MRLLERNSLTQRTVIEDISLPLDIEERDATATWTPENLEGISVGSWLLRDEDPGNGTVFVVRSIRRSFHNESARVQLEHVINLLKDKILFGEIKAKDITGNVNDTTCTARQAIEYVLSKQSDWVLGNFDYDNISNPYKFDGETLYDAIEKVSGSLEGAWWSYDMSVYPFELNITAKTENVESELRASRNLITIERTIEKTGMFTRFYPIGKDDLHIAGEYRSRNDDVFGVVEKSETDQSLTTEAELIAWADEQLSRHAEPLVSITAEGVEISKATGEPLDKINLGRYCRVPLPEYNTVITERIIKISYTDAAKMPELFKVTMANKREDVTRIIADAIKRGGGGRRHAARQGKDDHAWFEDTTDHVAMIAEGIAGEGAAEDWSRIAELLVDGNGIHQRVTEAQADIVTAYSLIDQTTTAIRLEIGTVASEVRSFIQQTPDMIHAEVGYAVSGFAHSVIEQTATYIRMEVENAASAISHSVIEQTTEYVRTEVTAVASGVAWSVITQTMTNIEQQIARKSKVYVQWTDPNDGVNVLYDGDIWIKRQTNRTWNEANAAHESWTQTGVSWRSKYGDLQYVWRNGKWNLLKDTSADVENEVKLEQTSDSLAVVGRAVDLQGQEFNSKLEVTARAIRGEVSTAKSQIYSTITQTATNIRSVVANELDDLQSSIEQTAESITTSVSAAKSSMYSVIQQTATNILHKVCDENVGNFSTIEQTSDSIKTSVSAAKSSLYSTIQQTATGIYTNVTDYVSGNYSTILQTSTNIAMAVKSAKDGLESKIDIEKDRIDLVVEGTGENAKIKPAEIVAAINATTGQSSVTISADHINLSGYVKATDITSEFINGKIAGIQSVGVKDLAASGSISIKEGNVYYAVARSIKDLDLSQTGNTYTLKYKKWDDSNWTTLGSFSRAVTSVSWSLSDGELKVTPQPQNQEFTLGSLTSYRTFSHNAQETPQNFERAANGYYIKDSGLDATVRIYTGADMTIGGKVLYSTSCDVDDYLETMPTNVYHDAFSAGKAAISSSDITVYDLFTTNAPSTPSEYERDNHGYYIKNAGTENAEVRIYTYAEITVNGKLLRTSSATQSEAKYDYLRVMPTYVYQDGFKAGYDADHSMFIGDADTEDVGTSVNVEVGTPVEVWAYFKKKNNQYQWSSKYTFTAVDPYPHSIAVTKAMTGVDQSELPVYYGKLYALIQGSYQAITSNNYYWYYSSTNISSRTLHY